MTTDTRGAVTLHWRCSDLHVDDADSVAILLCVLNNFSGLVVLLDLR
jgi:hypothetical protein